MSQLLPRVGRKQIVRRSPVGHLGLIAGMASPPTSDGSRSWKRTSDFKINGQTNLADEPQVVVLIVTDTPTFVSETILKVPEG